MATGGPSGVCNVESLVYTYCDSLEAPLCSRMSGDVIATAGIASPDEYGFTGGWCWLGIISMATRAHLLLYSTYTMDLCCY